MNLCWYTYPLGCQSWTTMLSWRKSCVPHLSGELATPFFFHWKFLCMDCCMFYLFITKYGYLPDFKSYDEDTYVKYFFLNLLMFVFSWFDHSLLGEVYLKQWTKSWHKILIVWKRCRGPSHRWSKIGGYFLPHLTMLRCYHRSFRLLKVIVIFLCSFLTLRELLISNNSRGLALWWV